MIEIKDIENSGVQYRHYRSKQKCNGVGACGERKFILTGYPKISVLKGSYKYPEEMQFSLVMPKTESPEFKQRNPNSNWNLVEINMPVEQGKELIEAVYKDLKL